MDHTTGEVLINEKKYFIKKMPLGKYVKVIKALKRLPEIVQKYDLQKFDQNAILNKLPELLEDSSAELFSILSTATDIPEDVIENEVGLEELTEIIILVFALNKFDKVKKNLEAIQAQWSNNKVAQIETKIKNRK